MCGIAGYYGTEQIDEGRLRKCLDLMHRRGPDYSAWHHTRKAEQHLYLLHSRLSIIDLDERAHQPMHFGDSTIILNGEIYNYLEIKEKLLKQGYKFTTTSDTEVVLKAIDCYGIYRALDLFEGMWAFALFEEKTGALYLCRDRFGEKPLYLYENSGGIYFSSEVKFIPALQNETLTVNYDHIYRYLVNGYKALHKTGNTFFKDVRQLDPACLLKVNCKGELLPERYWQFQFSPDDDMTFEQAVEGVQRRLIQSVRLRLRADVPLAFCMSGGVDSNSLISIAKRILDYDVHGFTIVNNDERYEEQAMVDHAVKELGIRHTAIPVEPGNFIANLKTLVGQHDAPVYTITYYAHWLLMAAIAAHGYRISISGTAADELFSGYYDHHLAYLFEIRNESALFESSLEAWKNHIEPIVRNPFLKNPFCFIDNPAQREHIYLNAGDFAATLSRRWAEPFREEAYCDDLLRNRMLNELFHESTPPILHEDDLNAMYYSIENRSPFLDRELFEFSMTIPTRHLIKDGKAKAVLREAMRGIVPDSIIDNRRKVGFNAPIFSYLDRADPVVKDYILGESPIFENVEREAIEKLLQKPTLPNSESKFLFYFLTSKMFLEEFGS